MRTTALLLSLLVGAACSSEPIQSGGGSQGGNEPVGGGGELSTGGESAGGSGGALATICNSGLSYSGEGLACLSENCCDAANDCTLDGSNVDGCLDCLIEGGEGCQALGECHNAMCVPSTGLCGTGLEQLYSRPGIDECMEENCCPELQACMGDPDLCMRCLEGGGGVECDDLVACMDSACFTGTADICDSGVTYDDVETSECLGEVCCAEFNACTNGGLDVDACITCFNDEGGPLCDDAIACVEASGCTP